MGLVFTGQLVQDGKPQAFKATILLCPKVGFNTLPMERSCDGLYMISLGSGTIRRCGPLEWAWPCWSRHGLVGVGVVLLE